MAEGDNTRSIETYPTNTGMSGIEPTTWSFLHNALNITPSECPSFYYVFESIIRCWQRPYASVL